MSEVERLKTAIDQYYRADRAFIKAREELRNSVRQVLIAKTAERGDGLVLSDKLGISLVHLSNLKGGYSLPSAEWAEKLMRVCEGM